MTACPCTSRNERKCARWYASAIGISEYTNARANSSTGGLRPLAAAMSAQVPAYSTRNSVGTATSPTVPTAVDPGATSAITPDTSAHAGVAVSPSNVTVASSSTTNTIIDVDTASCRSSPAAKGRTFTSRCPRGARRKQSPHPTHPPSRSAHSTAHAAHVAASVTRISVGAKRARKPNASENASPFRSHTSLPNTTIPAHVTAEYTSAICAIRTGTAASAYTNSAHAKHANRMTPGHAPHSTGYGRRSDSSAPGRTRRSSASAHSNSVRHGFTSAHTSPTSADAYASPTHHTTHTIVGARLFVGAASPNSPAATTSTNTPAAATCASSADAFHASHIGPRPAQRSRSRRG